MPANPDSVPTAAAVSISMLFMETLNLSPTAIVGAVGEVIFST